MLFALLYIPHPGMRKGGADDSETALTWRTAADIKDRRPEWGWTYAGGGRLPRSALSLFAARPGVGKSTAARWFAAGYTNGTIEGCFIDHPQNVAYIATEESLEAMVKPSLRAVGADMCRIHFPRIEMDGKQVRLLSALDEAALTADLLARGITVMIVDPVMSTVGGKVDLTRNNEIRECLEPWARMVEAINGLVLAIVHLIKAPGGDILAAINGSSAFGEVARAVVAFALDLQAADGTGVLSQEKNNAGRSDLALSTPSSRSPCRPTTCYAPRWAGSSSAGNPTGGWPTYCASTPRESVSARGRGRSSRWSAMLSYPWARTLSPPRSRGSAATTRPSTYGGWNAPGS